MYKIIQIAKKIVHKGTVILAVQKLITVCFGQKKTRHK